MFVVLIFIFLLFVLSPSLFFLLSLFLLSNLFLIFISSTLSPYSYPPPSPPPYPHSSPLGVAEIRGLWDHYPTDVGKSVHIVSYYIIFVSVQEMPSHRIISYLYSIEVVIFMCNRITVLTTLYSVIFYSRT